MKLTEAQERWLAALESEQYAQYTGALCRVDDDDSRSYCCLGVAEMSLGTETAGPVVSDGKRVMSFLSRDEDGDVEDSARCAVLSESVCRLGLRSPTGEIAREHKDAFDAALLRHSPDLPFKELKLAGCLASLNDKVRPPFKTIAAAIREVPEAVFEVC